MNQTESDKILNKIIRSHAKNADWKTCRGFVFKEKSLLFFTILITGHHNSKKLNWSLNFKLFDFDELFWKIVKLEENSKQPLSLERVGFGSPQAWNPQMAKVYYWSGMKKPYR